MRTHVSRLHFLFRFCKLLSHSYSVISCILVYRQQQKKCRDFCFVLAEISTDVTCRACASWCTTLNMSNNMCAVVSSCGKFFSCQRTCFLFACWFVFQQRLSFTLTLKLKRLKALPLPGTLRQRWKVTQCNNQVLYLTTLDLTVLNFLIQTVLLLHLNISIFVHS